LWEVIWRSHAPASLGVLLIIGFAAGVIFWGGFHTVVAWTNTESFCISCHEMEDYVYEEYKGTVHYTNPTGVRATCPDCHVPKEWGPKMIRKIQATNDLYHKILGTINTPKKFEAKRFELAKNVWRTMEETDSRECRNCHSLAYMDFTDQKGRAARKHKLATEKGQTCIDCHKGIAHELPEEYEEEEYEKE